MRRILATLLVGIAATAIVVLGTAADDGNDGGGYKVRAIFDNAFTVIPDLDVKIAGAVVGKVDSVDVTEDNRAAVVLDIVQDGFQDFRRDAQCTIRPQSLIGEKYIECSLTQPRRAGEQPPPPLDEIPEGEEGEGQRLLPVTQTSKPVDVDLINNINRLPQRQRLAIILNELGAGLAGRGGDLNETIRRANPALAATNEVLEKLGDQNQVLRQLAEDSDTVLQPLSRDRERVASFIENANDVSQATAERRQQLEANFERLPRFLSELRPTMTRLEGFADEFEPVLSDLQAAAPDINRLFQELGPFSQAGIPAFESLGEAAEVGRPALVASRPIVEDLRRLFGEARPLAQNLRDLTVSFRETGGIERLMDYIFFQVGAVNGYDSFGHYLRAGLIVNTCTEYTTTPQPGCSARFNRQDTSAEQARAASPRAIAAKFRERAGEDRSAQAQRAKASSQDGEGSSSSSSDAKASRSAGGDKAAAPLKLPSAVLPGQAPAPATPRQPSAQQQADPAAGGATPAQQGLLDYLLGSGS